MVETRHSNFAGSSQQARQHHEKGDVSCSASGTSRAPLQLGLHMRHSRSYMQRCSRRGVGLPAGHCSTICTGGVIHEQLPRMVVAAAQDTYTLRCRVVYKLSILLFIKYIFNYRKPRQWEGDRKCWAQAPLVVRMLQGCGTSCSRPRRVPL